MKTKEITPSQYAKWKGYTSPRYVQKKLKDGKSLEGVIKVNKYSRFYTLVVPENYSIPS